MTLREFEHRLGWGLLLALAGILLAFGLFLAQAEAQTAALLPNGMQQFADANGAPYASGSVYFYIPSTLTPKTTWQDPNQAVANSNPVVLDAAGRATIYGSGQYRQILKDQFGNTVWDKLTYGLAVNAAPINAPAFAVADIAALQAIDTTALSVGTYIQVNTYSVANGQSAPPVVYKLASISGQPATCVLDGGSCIHSTASTNSYWTITPHTVYDPRWWGAYGDVKVVRNTTTTTAGSGSVTVAGANCTSAYAGASIVISDVTSTSGVTPQGASYQGTISSCAGTAFTVSPNVGFNSSITQNVVYGHIDTSRLQAYITYLGTLVAFAADYIPANFGGLSYGVDAPLLPVAGVHYANGSFHALASASFSASNGIFSLAPSDTAWDHIYIDCDFLPVSGMYVTANGITTLHDVQVRHWFGSFPGAINVSLTGTSGAGQVTAAGTTTGITGMMIAHGSAAAGVPDRTVVVATPTTGGGNTTISLSKPLTSSPAGTAATFYNEPGGFVVTGNGGIHGQLITANQFDASDLARVNSADNYGYGMLYEATGQSDFWHFTEIGSAVGVGIGPTAAQGIDFVESHVFSALYNTAELDPPAVLIADANNPAVLLDKLHETGAIQFFFVNNATASLSVSNLVAGTISPATLTNNAVVQLVSMNATPINSNQLRLDTMQSIASSQVSYDFRGFPVLGCGVNWSFTSYSCAELASIRHTISGDGLFPRRATSLSALSMLSNAAGTSLLCDGGTPTIFSGFGGATQVTTENGTCSFRITVVNGATDNGGVLTFPNASLNNWNCWANNMTTQTMAVGQLTGGNDTSGKAQFRTQDYATGTHPNFNANDVIQFSCRGE